MSSVDSKKKETKKTVAKMVYSDAAYFNTQFIGENKLTRWFRDVWMSAQDNYPDFFPEGSDPEFVVTLLPISLLNIEKAANLQQKGLSSSSSYIETRAAIEMYRILDDSFPADQGTNLVTHHQNTRNKGVLLDLITKLLTPDRRKTSSSLFKLLSGRANFHSKSEAFVNVLAGRHPNGSIHRERTFKIPGTTEVTVADKRALLISERGLTPYKPMDMTYYIPDLDQIKLIVSYMTADFTENLSSIGSIIDASELTIRFIISKIKGLYGDEGNEFNAVELKDDFDAFSNEHGNFTLVGVGGKSVSTADGAIQKAIIEFIANMDLELEKKLDGVNQGTIVVGTLVNMVHHHLLTKLHLRTDERNRLSSFLQMRGPVIAAFAEKFGGTGPNSFVIPSAKFSAFSKGGAENIKSYIYRLKTFSNKTSLEIALIESVLKKYNSRVDTGDFALPEGYIFNVHHLLETVNKVSGTAFTPQEPGFSSLYNYIETLESTMKNGLQQIEDDLDEEFGESKVVPAMTLPPLTLREMDTEHQWVEVMLKKFYRDIYERLPADIYEDSAKDALVASMIEAVEIGAKLSEVEDFFTLNFKASQLEDIEDRINLIFRLKSTNFAPKFNDFEYEPKDGVENEMVFNISGKTLIIGGSKISVDKIFYKDDGSSEIPGQKYNHQNDNPRVVKHGSDVILRNYFEPMFKRFVTIGHESFDISFAQVAVDEHGRTRYRTYMTVKCASQEDVYKMSKFRTRFETAPIDVILAANPDFGDSYAITPDYTIYWQKTDSQRVTIAGTNNENTFKFYETSEGCALQFPFTDGRFQASSRKIMSDYNAKVYRVYTPRTGGPGTSAPGPGDFGPDLSGGRALTASDAAVAWGIHTANLRTGQQPENNTEIQTETQVSQDARNQDRDLISRRPRGFKGGRVSTPQRGNESQPRTNNSKFAPTSSRLRKYFAVNDDEKEEPEPSADGSESGRSSVRISEQFTQNKSTAEKEPDEYVVIRGRKYLVKDVQDAKDRERKAGSTPAKLHRRPTAIHGQRSGSRSQRGSRPDSGYKSDRGYASGDRASGGRQSSRKSGATSSDRHLNTVSPGRGNRSGDRHIGTASPGHGSVTSFDSTRARSTQSRSRSDSPSQIYPSSPGQDTRQTAVTIGLLATGRRMADIQAEHDNIVENLADTIPTINLNADNADEDLDF